MIKARLLILLLITGFYNLMAKDADIMDFGAAPGGSVMTTLSFQNAVDYCSETGGGTVNVPAGVYLTGTIFLKNSVNLYLERGAVLLGSTDRSAFKGAVVYAAEVRDCSITGEGTIDGQGFARYFPVGGPRHNNILLFRSRNISVKGITLINSPGWVFRIRECDGVVVSGVKIYSYANQNNDGLDIEGKNIIVSDCIIDCEDDAICLKSDNPEYIVENIAITNCIVATNCNAIKFGTSSYGGFRNISISNCVVRWPSEAAKIPPRSTLKGCEIDAISEIGLALEVVDGGFMDQVTITNITMTGIQTPLFIRLANRNGPGSLKNVVISNITATDETMLNSSITGIPGSYVENVILKNFIFNSKGTGTITEAASPIREKIAGYPQANGVFGYATPSYGMYVRHVKNLVLDNFVMNLKAPDARPAIVLDDAHNIRISNFSAGTPTDNQPLLRFVNSTNVTVTGYLGEKSLMKFLTLEGDTSSNIKLKGNEFSLVQKVVEFSGGAGPGSVMMMNNTDLNKKNKQR